MPKTKSRDLEPQGIAQEAVMDEEAPPSHQPPTPDDEAAEQPAGSEDGAEEEEVVEQKVKILPGSTATSACYEFTDEGHTLGNALRYVIMKNPDVEFCAYAVPHPSETKMNVRIQTYEGTAIQALEKGLRDVQELCEVVARKFWDARAEFRESGGDFMES